MHVTTDRGTATVVPMARIAERVCSHYLPMAVGFTVVCCPNPAEVTRMLPRIQPRFFCSPPRLWEKIQASIAADVAAGADHADLRRRWGFGELVTALTGAAPCPPGLIEFFASIGIELREVYLLLETTGVVSLPAAHDVRGGNRADIATLNRSGSLDARFCLSHGFMHVVAHETETL